MIINANNYSLSPRRFVAGTKGSYGIETMNFEFSEEWENLSVSVTFFPTDSEPVTVIHKKGFPFLIPGEVLSASGLVPYTVVGHAGSKQLVSLTGYIDVLETTLGKGNSPIEPSPTAMSQIFEFMSRCESIARSVRDDADNGAFDGKSIISAEINSSGELVLSRDDGVSFNAGNIVSMVLAAIPDGDEVSF